MPVSFRDYAPTTPRRSACGLIAKPDLVRWPTLPIGCHLQSGSLRFPVPSASDQISYSQKRSFQVRIPSHQRRTLRILVDSPMVRQRSPVQILPTAHQRRTLRIPINSPMSCSQPSPNFDLIIAATVGEPSQSATMSSSESLCFQNKAVLNGRPRKSNQCSYQVHQSAYPMTSISNIRCHTRIQQ